MESRLFLWNKVKMPIKCSCVKSISECKLHTICGCGQVKKIVSDCCRDCYLDSVSSELSDSEKKIIKYEECICGGRKKLGTEFCIVCYRKHPSDKYKCQTCGKKRTKSTSKQCRNCYDSERTFKILNDTRPISSVLYTCGERNKHTGVRKHASSVMNTLKIPKVCSCCPFPIGIQICHVHSITDFPEDTPLNVVNSPDNLILLCPNCHWLFDHGYPSVELIKQYLQKISTI